MPRRMRKANCLALAFVLITIGCGRTEPPHAQRPMSFDSAFTLVHSVQLKTTKDDPVGRVGRIIRWHGTIVIIDEFQDNLKVFDTSGALLRTIGRAGDGPGEFRQPTWGAELSDGSLAVLDLPRVYVSLFAWPGKFTSGWFIHGTFPGGVAVLGDTLVISATLVANRRVDTTSDEVQFYRMDGTPVGGVLRYQPPRNPYGVTLGTETSTLAGRTVVLAAMDTNRVRLFDLDSGVERVAVIGQDVYQSPSWPRTRPSGIPELVRWANAQLWLFNVFTLGNDRFIADFVRRVGPDSSETHQYAVASVDGRTLRETQPTNVAIRGSWGDTVAAVSETLSGGAELRLYVPASGAER